MHVISSLTGSGGAEHGLVREITRFGSDVDQMVVTLYPPNILGDQLVASGVVVRELGLNPSSSGWNWIPATLRLRKLLDEYQPDVVQSSLASGNLAAQMATAGKGIPVLSTFTLSGDPELMRVYQPGAASRRAAFLRRVEARTARGRHVWFRSLTRDSAETNSLAMGIDPGRITVIPRGVPLPVGDEPNRQDLGLPADVPVLLNVGRQSAQKGHVDLVEAFAYLRRGLDAHLVILGREGDGSARLQEAIERFGVSDAVSVIAYTDRPYDFYRTADVFVFSSHMEGLGTAVLEAMACRLPVVACEIPPVAEIVGEESLALLVAPGDPSALAEGVRAVLESPEQTAQRVERAQLRVASRYSPDAVAKQVEARLRELAAHVDS